MHLPKEGMGWEKGFESNKDLATQVKWMALPQQECSKISALPVESHRPPSIEWGHCWPTIVLSVMLITSSHFTS